MSASCPLCPVSVCGGDTVVWPRPVFSVVTGAWWFLMDGVWKEDGPSSSTSLLGQQGQVRGLDRWVLLALARAPEDLLLGTFGTGPLPSPASGLWVQQGHTRVHTGSGEPSRGMCAGSPQGSGCQLESVTEKPSHDAPANAPLLPHLLSRLPYAQAWPHFDMMLTHGLENDTELLSSVYFSLKILSRHRSWLHRVHNTCS